MPEEVEKAIYGKNLADQLRANPDKFYGAFLEKSGRIRVRTKYEPPVGGIATLAYRKRLHLTMEFDSVASGEAGSMRFFRKNLDPGIAWVAPSRPRCRYRA